MAKKKGSRQRFLLRSLVAECVQQAPVVVQLPTEMWVEIIYWLTKAKNVDPLRTLCLVCRRLRDIAQPVLLKTVILGSFTTHARRKPSQLKSLSNGNCAASRFSTTLCIDYSEDFRGDRARVLNPLELTMLRHLKAAIQSFKKLSSVTWKLGFQHPSWFPEIVAIGLSDSSLTEFAVTLTPHHSPFSNLPTLPNLRSFSISIPTSSWGQPAIVTAVARLIAQSRHLVRLEINIQTASILDIFTSVNTSGTRLALEHLSLNRIGVTREGIAAALPHLMKLVSLKLLSDPNVYGHSVSVTDIWTPFLQRKIWLKSIAIDCGSDESFQSYVQVAPGIVALVLQAPSRHPPIVQGVRSSPTLISILESISPYLAESLVELDIVPSTIQYPTDWNWPYDEQLLKLLASLHRLERLGVHVDYSSCGASELSKYMGEKVIDPFLKMSNDFTNLKTIILAFHYPSYALDWEHEAIKTQVKDAIRAHPITSATFKGCFIEFEDAVFALRQCVNCGHHHYDYL